MSILSLAPAPVAPAALAAMARGVLAGLAAVPVTQPATAPASASSDAAEMLLIGGISLVCVVGAALLGVLRPRNVDGRLRIERGRPVWPLLLACLAGFVAWIGSQMAYGLWIGVRMAAGGGKPSGQDLTALLTSNDWVVLSLAPPAAGFLGLLAGDYIYNRMAIGWLGFDLGRMPKGLAKGVLTAVLVIPVTFLVGSLVELVFQRMGYHHAGEHELLKVMKEAPSPTVKWALVAAAVIAAPFFEEYFFRGHVQTLIRQGLVSLTQPLPPQVVVYPAVPVAGIPPTGMAINVPPGAPAGIPGTPAAAPYDAPAPPPAPQPVLPYQPQPQVMVIQPQPGTIPDRPHVWQTWAAILITSVLFMLVHYPQVWMFPTIYFLSIWLGYAYERTGSLWVNITLHAMFNGTSTLLFLWQNGML